MSQVKRLPSVVFEDALPCTIGMAGFWESEPILECIKNNISWTVRPYCLNNPQYLGLMVGILCFSVGDEDLSGWR